MLDAAGRDGGGVPPRAVFGIRFSDVTLDALAERICSDAPPPGHGLNLLVTTNLDHVVRLTRNQRFRDAYRHAWMAVVDGAPVLLYCRLRGLKIPGRVTGADLFPVLLSKLRPGVHRLMLLCASETTAAELDAKLRARGFTDHLVLAAPPAFEEDREFAARLLATLNERRTTHLFFGIGAPKSEIWMHEHRHELPDCFGFAFGAGLDFHAGTKRRAPALLRRFGLEFLWRVATEPRRLAKRYFLSSWTFLLAIGFDLLGRPPQDR